MEVKIIGTEIIILRYGREIAVLTAVEALELLRELRLDKDALDTIVYTQLEEEEEEQALYDAFANYMRGKERS